MMIEDIVLSRDQRGVSKLRGHVPPDFCDQAAGLILEHPGLVMIVTGFYIMAARATETDGPPGAIAIGNALKKLDTKVVYVSDTFTTSILRKLLSPEEVIIDFPVTDHSSSRQFAVKLLDDLKPSVLVAIERCGLTEEGTYRNIRGIDFSEYNAKVDYLFKLHPCSVGIGDGGNEIGMGNVASIVPTIPTLVRKACVTQCTRLLISSVSNWGGFGLVAAISRRVGKNLLPSVEEESELVKKMVDLGAVDGISREQKYYVDGMTLEENNQVLIELHQYLSEQGIR